MEINNNEFVSIGAFTCGFGSMRTGQIKFNQIGVFLRSNSNFQIKIYWGGSITTQSLLRVLSHSWINSNLSISKIENCGQYDEFILFNSAISIHVFSRCFCEYEQ